METMHIIELGNIIKYGSEGFPRKIRMVRGTLNEGHIVDAMAYGNITETLSKGMDVNITRTTSQIPEIISNNYIVVQKA